MNTTDTQTTAAELRAQAGRHHTAAGESFDRCDTDGFLSQWANDITGRKLSLQADITDKGGVWEFPALFTTAGELVAAKLITTQFGTSWALLASDDPDSAFIGWVNRSKARKAATRNANMAKKGYSEGTVLAAARADIGGSGTGLSGAASCYVYVKRVDGGFSRTAQVVTTQATTDPND